MLTAKVINSSVVVEEHNSPKCNENQIVVRMRSCGLCGSDLEKVYGNYSMQSIRIGHEPAGEVIKVGSKVSDFTTGDRVFVHHHVSCYSCTYCLHGDYTMCEMYQKSNLEPCGLSEEFLVPEWNIGRGGLLRLPENISYDQAALIEPLGCCIRGFNKISMKHGDNIAIIGAGPAGIMHLLLAERAGANQVFVVDINDFRLKFARSYQRTFAFNPRQPIDIVERIMQLSSGIGVDSTIIATSSPEAFGLALKITRKGGKILMFGVPPKNLTAKLDLSLLYSNELTLSSSYGCSEVETNHALTMISENHVDIRPLITHRFDITKSAEAFQCAHDAKNAMKVIITSQE
jgi:L-iditol 2-dehydrogenase